MTRHNLDIHISWLLSREVSPPPAGVPVNALTNSTTGAGTAHSDILEDDTIQEVPRAPPSPVIRREIAPTVNVGQDFIRPTAPSSIFPKISLRNPINSLAETSMGRLASASKSAKPSLMSQHQLATPASTTASSSLTQGYITQLKGEAAGTPSTKPIIDLTFPKSARQFQTPQTPRHTPRSTSRLKIETVESVDLTGDYHGEHPTSRSSSTDIGFGEPTLLWREDSASRAESLPVARSSRKRKSDELSLGMSQKRNINGSQVTITEAGRRDSVDEFVDIDDVNPTYTHYQPTSDKGLVKSVRPSIEHAISGDDVEEYQITETINRVETRTRKGISRISSTSEGTPGPIYPKLGSLSESEPRVGNAENASRSRSAIQVKASPISKSMRPAASESLLTPQRRKKSRTQRTIVDSEDDEVLSEVEKRASCSPRTLVKKTPRISQISRSPNDHELPPFVPKDLKAKDVTDSRPRIGSPLRPISQNVRQESAPPSDSSLKVASTQQSSEQASPHTLTDKDRKLVNFYLGESLAILTYRERVKVLIEQNAAAVMEYVDQDETAPKHLKEERQTLLIMNKAYASLEDLAKTHKTLVNEKKDLLKAMLQAVDTGIDTSAQETRMSIISQDVQKVEREVGQMLYVSGAIKDGFGTGVDLNASKGPPAASLKGPEGTGYIPSGSSTTGSAQIIAQTQIPSLQPKSSSNQQVFEDLPYKSSTRSMLIPYSGLPIPQSPSPVRHTGPPKSFPGQYLSNSTEEPWAASRDKLRQPNFRADPSPADYNFDDDQFEDLLQEEQELHQTLKANNQITSYVEDDYGDDDDDAMLEIAQEVEKRNSMTGPIAKKPEQKTLSDISSRNRSNADKTMYSHVDLAHSGMFSYPWSDDVKRALKERFKLTGFRHHQLDAINATLSGGDAFILMPTGGGKSLCYQLPAIVQSGKTKGVTIVISPLLSLMNDQVDHLRKLNIRAATLNGEIKGDERRTIQNQLTEPYPEQFIQLLYITPEMINKSGTIVNILTQMHKNNKLARIVIDEAHCVSQWGHDFRSDYLELGKVREKFPNVPLMALTATATKNVKVDVMHNLGMETKCPVFAQSFNRPNLHYEVRSKKGKGKAKEILDEMADMIKTQYRGQTGIIYTLSQKNCEQMSAKLQQDYRIRSHHFHAGMKAEEKRRVQRDWQSGVIQVVVATIAFGMGIDKPDVRFVIHHTIPKSLEGYYQETGRAGRDGKKSGCYLYYGYQDTKILKDFIYESDASHEQKERQSRMLTSMISYCENPSDCRRVQVLAYFGEPFSKEDCKSACDNCKSDAVYESIDFSREALAAMKIVKQVQGSQVTMLHCIEILRGAGSTKIRTMGHHQLQEYGFAKDQDRRQLERLFERLMRENALAENNVVNKRGFATQYIMLGENCRDFLAGRRKLMLQIKVSGSPPVQPKKKQSYPPSTLLTSPITSPSKPKGRKKPSKQRNNLEEDEYGNTHNDFIVPDNNEDDDYEEAFESMGAIRTRRGETSGLGPPITADEQMAALPELHRVVISQFVQEAKQLEEKIRNKTAARKPFFTEIHLREMAIKWTLTLEDMLQIPDVNIERVNTYGKRFIPLVERYYKDYEEMMNNHEDQDIDENHKNVINLCSDEEAEEDFGLDDEEEDEDDPDILAAERSTYFTNPAQSSGKGARKLPWSKGTEFQSGSGSGSYASRRGRGGKRGKWSRKSNGSTSGQSNSGVSKRRSSSRPSKPRGGKSTGYSSRGGSSIMAQFGKRSGSSSGGRGGGGGGIGMMPT